ncbi:MAG: metalloregulator ArsR/SmtB family transcription factor [Syntrophorhabdaceae bacterium]|nr:metalloregulator ArsR/SmtB family transcription factor [Syntrophorhabdaceae bacterium]
MLDTFRALADETRLRILKLLETGELCVCDITAALDMVQPKVSFHLKVLKNAGLLRDKKCGKWMHYELDISHILKRIVILTALEGIPDDISKKDRERLEYFLKNKHEGAFKDCVAPIENNGKGTKVK